MMRSRTRTRTRTRTRRFSLFVIVLLLISSLIPSAVLAQEGEDAPPTGIRFDAPPYAVDGPYAVGVRYFTIPAESETDRELTASVWYPALNPDGVVVEMQYELNFEPGDFPPFTVLGHALLDAEADASSAPYPLVVYSHAHWSMGQEAPYFTEHLASRGFVVIAVDHEDNWSTDLGPMAFEALIRRTQEVTRQIDFAENLSAEDGAMPGMIATEQVGAGGWSMGGVTSLMAAGAQIDLANLRSWCEEDPSHVEAAVWACVDILDREAEMAQFAGLDEIPPGLWPTQRDERVVAAVRLSGSLPVFGSDGLASVDVPVLLMHGGHEEAIDPSLEYGMPYESVQSPRKGQVIFENAGHLLFNSSCEDNPEMAAMFPSFCADPVWDMDRAHDLINHFATAFLLAELKGDEEAASALAPEQVAFPGIEYRSQGYAKLTKAQEDAIAALVERVMTRHDIPGAAVGVVQGSELVYANGFGVAGLEDDTPIIPDSIFLMASVSKSFTGMAVMQLVEEGLIDLDAPVTTYLPYFEVDDPNSEAITVRHLLAHTSGLTENPDWKPFFLDEDARTDEGALEAFVRSLDETPLAFEPGSAWMYSSPGFDILGDVIAKVSGQSFESYVQREILAPLGMDNSTFLFADVDPALLAEPHMLDEDGMAETPEFFPYSRTHAPGAMLFSTVNDMARFAIANLQHGTLEGTEVLSASVHDEMWQPQMRGTWAEMFGTQTEDYALGWWLGTVAERKTVGNYGAVEGYQAHLGIFPDDNLAVTAMVNVYDSEAGVFPALEIGLELSQMLLEETDEEAAPSASVNNLDPALAAKVDAVFDATMAGSPIPGMVMCIVKDGDMVYSRADGVAETGTEQAVTLQSVFEMRSISKPLVSMAIMQLVDQGLVDPNALVTDYLPDFTMADPRYEDITVAMLLQHTSGLPATPWDFTAIEGESPIAQAVASLADVELLSDPGTAWLYTPKGYAVLGEIIATVSGEAFADYMQRHLLEAMGMTHSAFGDPDVDEGLRTRPHISDEDGNVIVGPPICDPRHAPACALQSNCEDMVRLVNVIMSDGRAGDVEIVAPGDLEMLWSGSVETPWVNIAGAHYGNPMATYGLGWFVGEVDGHRLVGHSGGNDGYNAHLLLAPDEGVAVISMANWLQGAAAPASFATIDVMYTLLEIETD